MNSMLAARAVMALPVVALFFFAVASDILQAQPAPTQKPLNNGDIIALTKAGLSEIAISAVIRNSPNEFDLSPDALLTLKKAGVGNQVIEAMLGSPRQSPVSPDTAGESTLPTAYGYYVSDGTRFTQLQPSQVTSKIALSPGGSVGVGFAGGGYGFDGLSGDPTARTRDATPTLIIHQQTVNIANLHVAPLVYVKSMQAYQFNMGNTAPQFFTSIYGRGYYDVIPVELWRPSADLEVRVEPVGSKQGMYRIIPQSSLAPGRYVLYFADAIHKDGIIFAVRAGRRTEGLYFERTATPTASTNPEASAAPCADYQACMRGGRAALNASRWDEALSYFKGIIGLGPSNESTGWTWSGHVYLASARYDEARSTWDEGLKAGAGLGFLVCWQRFISCDRVGLRIGAKEISLVELTGERKRIFAADPKTVVSEISKRGPKNAYVKLVVSGRNYNLFPVPPVIECKTGLVVECAEPGDAQQAMLADYMDRSIKRLATGERGK